jgi:hypothetical protein
MDGYVVAPHGTEVELGNGVRHIAQLENGEVFVAFEGDRPCAGALLISDELTPWTIRRVRKGRPVIGEEEAFYLLPASRLEDVMSKVTAATLLASGNVLVMTNGEEIPGAIWGSVAVSYIDERLATV